MLSYSEVSSSPQIGGPKLQTARRRFFQWAVKWFYANFSEDVHEKPDAPILAALFQSLGFQLRSFENVEEDSSVDQPTLKADTIRVTIECGTSRMRATLELDDVECKCPKAEDAKDASFWSVSGTGRVTTATCESTTKIEESGSNLIPTVSKEKTSMINDVIHHLLIMINDNTSEPHQTSKNRSSLNLNRIGSTNDETQSIRRKTLNIVRSYTQPEIVISNACRTNWANRQLDKENTQQVPNNINAWGQILDIECDDDYDNDQPRPSPPTISSSPVFINQLCSSLGQISVDSAEGATNIADYVRRAHLNLEKALEIIGKNSPSSGNSSTHERGTFLKPAAGHVPSRKQKTSIGSNSPTIPRSGSTCSIPSRVSSVTNSSRSSTLSVPIKSPLKRRSVTSSLLSFPSTPLSTVAPVKRCSTIIIQQSSALKNSPRRKSFGTFTNQPSKLAALKAKNTTLNYSLAKNSTLSKDTAVCEGAVVTPKTKISSDVTATLGNSINNRSGIQRPMQPQTLGLPPRDSSSSSLKAPSTKIASKVSNVSKDPKDRKSFSFSYAPAKKS